IRQHLDKISALEENNKRLSDKNLELSGKEKTEHEELQKVKAENDLRNKYYNAAIRENPMPVLIADNNLRIKLCNNAFEIMSGIPEQKLRSMSIKDFNIIEKKGDDYLKAIETGRRSRSELKIKMPSGTCTLEQYAIPLRGNGNVELLLIYKDITKEREEAEEIKNKLDEIEALKKRSEIIVQENPMPILLMNKRLGIIVANPAFEEMSGIPLHNITKMSARDFKVLKQEGKGLKHTLENKIRASGEVEIEMPTGIHILEQYSIPIINDKREVINILAVYNDVTEIRKKNAEIEELREKEREEAKILTESIDLITEKMIGMTSGDLTVNVEIFEDDPLALLKKHFNSSVKEFGDLISVINEKANVIESTAEELSSNSDDIARANEKLALNSEESAEFLRDLMERFERISLGISDLSASIEEISSTSQEVTKQANQAAVEGKNAAEIGKEASENMENVGRISQQSVNEINLLNQEMYKINDIVKLIGGIAEQTNMLALNAAIEAARAGEHGRGFSVVAGEIRNLAGESKEATRTIELLISEIQKNSNNTASSMRQADDEIQTGIESVNLAVNALNNIANDIEIASRGITEISHATETQAYEINSFMNNIEEANALTRGNLEKLEGMAAMAEEISATTEEVGSISHEMHNLSSGLQETMKKFRINSN
ncbi:MAG: PAS domain-containing methyl-accepting chemotaxis protein, partial [Methanomicrobiaceae archaeon]|nr:PAS domain-containing methyl-accepting chemotaxis protein [Methanomicrobiaceae archaeon]